MWGSHVPPPPTGLFCSQELISSSAFRTTLTPTATLTKKHGAGVDSGQWFDHLSIGCIELKAPLQSLAAAHAVVARVSCVCATVHRMQAILLVSVRQSIRLGLDDVQSSD